MTAGTKKEYVRVKLKGMIFDLDGTLLDTLPVCYMGFRQALGKHLGREFDEQAINALFGPSEEGIFKQLVPENWQACLADYLAAYDQAHPAYARPFPGVEEALGLLQERDMRLGIVSGKGPGSMAISLRHSGLGRFFQTVVTGSELGAAKPVHIRQVLAQWGMPPADAAYIGDTPYDIKSAREVGVLPLGAAWTKTARTKGMAEKQPAALFAGVDDFVRWIKDNL